MDESGDGQKRTAYLARWRALSPWTQYLVGAAVLCAGSLLWSAVPADSGPLGSAIKAMCWIVAPVTASTIWRDVFAHRWGPDQVAGAVWIGVACGVFICVPSGSVVQALLAGPLFGAFAWFLAEVGIRDRRRRLPPPPLLPPPPPRVEA